MNVKWFLLLQLAGTGNERQNIILESTIDSKKASKIQREICTI